MRDIEQLATIASIRDKSYKYPTEEIDNMWESILLCQFHDCLPGSSIEMCYDDSDKVRLLLARYEPCTMLTISPVVF